MHKTSKILQLFGTFVRHLFRNSLMINIQKTGATPISQYWQKEVKG